MRRFKLSELHIDLDELKTKLGEGNTIFIGSGTDMFASNVPDKWIELVMDRARQFPNTYFFQSKNPARMLDHADSAPRSSIFCTTIESNIIYPGIIGRAPVPQMRHAAAKILSTHNQRVMVTVEPILDFDEDLFLDMLIDIRPEQVNIGADSKGHRLPEPKPEKVIWLIRNLLDAGIKVHRKRNLMRILDRSEV
jgi:DNA repair photolyase